MDNLPEEMLHLILYKVAANGHRDLHSVMTVCKYLNKAGLDRNVFRVLSLSGINTSPRGRISDGMNLFLQRLYEYENPEYYIRVGVEKLHMCQVDAAVTLFQKAAAQGHDYAIYAYANVLVLWNNESLVGEGCRLLKSLFDRQYMFTARNAFWDKVRILGLFWVKQRLPAPLQYNTICKANGACGGVYLIDGKWVPFREYHIRTYCVNCRLDAEVQLFLDMIQLTYEAPVDHCSNLAFYVPDK